ncbi:hypothetical protein LWI28_002686 [Acer negundo]|uniref:Uncharacterized protein n=1 Tax=Acer negundo TaxID=4023 RepID=A0AAD5JI30_ACENE|nr:hypothetical protein LWI28_002686 [Acer negundo]
MVAAAEWQSIKHARDIHCNVLEFNTCHHLFQVCRLQYFLNYNRLFGARKHLKKTKRLHYTLHATINLQHTGFVSLVEYLLSWCCELY